MILSDREILAAMARGALRITKAALAALDRAHSRRAAQTRLRHAELDEKLLARDSEDDEYTPDTDRTYTMEQMARAWEALSRPLLEDDAELSFDPDEHPLF